MGIELIITNIEPGAIASSTPSSPSTLSQRGPELSMQTTASAPSATSAAWYQVERHRVPQRRGLDRRTVPRGDGKADRRKATGHRQAHDAGAE